MKSHYKFILASIAFHLALLLLLLWPGEPQRLAKPKSEAKPIQAYFVKTVKPKPEEPKTLKVESEAKEEPQPKQKVAPEPVAEKAKVEVVSETVKEEKQPAQQNVSPAPVIEQQPDESKPVDLPTPQTVDSIKSNLGIPRASMLQNSLSILRSQTNQQTVVDATGEFGARRSLSVMDGEPIGIEHSDLPEEGPQIKPVEVNCNNTGAKAMSLLSGLFGGTINCAKGGDFQHYIDKRLERLEKRPEQSGR